MGNEEWFDVVDDRDEILYQAPRSEVHARRLNHRAVHIWVFHPDGRLLLQLRTPTKDRHPNTWDSSASGHVDAGEAYPTAARRELEEELAPPHSLTLKEIAYVSACEATGQEFIKLYRTESEGPFTPCPKEIALLKWIEPATLEAWMKSDPDQFAPALPYLWGKVSS